MRKVRSICGISEKENNQSLSYCTIRLLAANMDDLNGTSRPKLHPAMICPFDNLFYQRQCKYTMSIGVV